MADNVNINVTENIDQVNIVASEIVEVVDLNLYATTEDVTINVTEEIIQVNINKVTNTGSQTLAETLAFGNITDGTDIAISDGDEITFDNGSRIRKGLTDSGNGGAKGVALVCSLDYELKWEAGRQYVMQQDGFTIREVSNNFTITPTATDDETKGFVIGSRWILDNGDVYECTDATEANAVWELQVDGTVTNIGLTMPPAFSVANSPITSSGDIAVTGAGTVNQYVRGDGTLANFPNSTGGGASVNYYLNGSVSQGTFGGTTYYQMSKTPILGTGTNFIRTNGQGNGYIASFITDAGDPSFLNIPGGNWNLEFYFQSSASGGSPQFYGEIYKVSDTNVFTLIASGSVNPEGITNGTTVDQYFTSIPVPQTSLLITDRLAVRIYVITSGRTITLHTENGNLCEVLTTFTTGLTALNGLTTQVQNFAVGTSGTDFNISSATDTHTFNLPTASATNRGALSSADWTMFNNKQNALTNPITGTGANGQVAFFNGTTTQTGDNGLFWDTTLGRLELTTSNLASSHLLIKNSSTSNILTLRAANADSFIEFNNRLFIQSSSGFSINQSGNIGMGVSSPTLAKLHVNGNTIIGASTTTAGARLDVRAQGALSTDIAFRVRNSANTANLIQVNGLGGVEINSTTQGFLPPRMTTTERNAIATPAAGLIVYNTTDNKHYGYNGTTWNAFY
jgi:hypothetical protein